MKCVILCGGLGTRFSEETDLKPKPMIEIGGKPILQHLMECYSRFGFTEFILCGGYKVNVIKDYFLKGKLAGGIIQFEEANLMFNIADQFIREHDITTLTVHDELIVQEKYHPMVKEFMYSSGSSEICSKFSLMHKIKHM